MAEEISFRTFLIRRAMLAPFLVLGVIIVNFILLHLAPGDPALIAAGERATAEAVAIVREKYGLDKPLVTQLAIYILTVLKGDLGFTYARAMPVLPLILTRIPATMLLMGCGLGLAYSLGIVLGVSASSKPYSWRDNAISFSVLLGYSIPPFWLGMLLILIFSIFIPVFPTGGMTSPGGGGVFDMAFHLVLPVITLSAFYLALIARMTRGNMLETLTMDFITFAKSKGLAENTVVYKHALRNAILPPLTVMGIHISLMFGGAVMTETVFAWPGMGRLIFEGLLQRDYPLMMGIFILMSFFVIAATVIIDIIYALVDPRIRYR
jgi:peptide/nickel transport system permease protein